MGLPRHASQHSGRDGDLDPAADRRLPGRAGGDGGAPDRPVGQGLLRATPASSRSTCSGWGCSRRSSAASKKSTRTRGERLDLSRIDSTTRDLRIDPRRRDHRRLPDREPRPDADAAAHPAAQPRRPHRAGGAGPAGPDPGRRRPSLHRAAQAAARGPELRGPLRARAAAAGAGGDAGRRSSTRSRCSRWRWRSPASPPRRPRGCGGR